MKEKLEQIVQKAISENDFEKLKHIGLLLDVLLFDKQYKDYYNLFLKIDRFLNEYNQNLLKYDGEEIYQDLLDIGFNDSLITI